MFSKRSGIFFAVRIAIALATLGGWTVVVHSLSLYNPPSWFIGFMICALADGSETAGKDFMKVLPKVVAHLLVFPTIAIVTFGTKPSDYLDRALCVETIVLIVALILLKHAIDYGIFSRLIRAYPEASSDPAAST